MVLQQVVQIIYQVIRMFHGIGKLVETQILIILTARDMEQQARLVLMEELLPLQELV